MEPTDNPHLFKILVKKGTLKQEVYNNTLNSFRMIKKVIGDMIASYDKEYKHSKKKIPFEYKETGEFELHIKFAGDILIFIMHTNIFEFSRDHEVMKTAYIKKDRDRSYCGIIQIFNFLADSFKYNRGKDVGYLIGRVFVNKDMSYFIEGKREIGMLYPNFGKAKLDEEAVQKIVESAMLYTINFDLLTPPYQSQVQVSVQEMKSIMDSQSLKTGKRLGFKFQADKELDP